MFVMRCVCFAKWSKKMVVVLFTFLHKLFFELNNKPNLHDDHLLDTFSSCFVALKLGLPLCWDGFVLYYYFVMVLKRHWAHGGILSWRDTWVFYPIIPTKAVCQMLYISCGSAIECLKWCLVFHFTGQRVQIKSKRIDLMLRLWHIFGLIDLWSWSDVLLGSL